MFRAAGPGYSAASVGFTTAQLSSPAAYTCGDVLQVIVSFAVPSWPLDELFEPKTDEYPD